MQAQRAFQITVDASADSNTYRVVITPGHEIVLNILADTAVVLETDPNETVQDAIERLELYRAVVRYMRHHGKTRSDITKI